MQIVKASFSILLLSIVSAFPVEQQDNKAVTLASSRFESVETNADVDKSADLLGWQSSVLTYHNGWRAHHQVDPLVWSDTLAQAANQSATKCRFQLTPNNKYGENIAVGSYTNPPWYAQMWYDGSSMYNYDKPGFSQKTGTFTQVVWKDTKRLGCAYVKNCPGSYPNMLFCEYEPAGNIIPDSNFAKQVLRPVAHPPNPSPPPMWSED